VQVCPLGVAPLNVMVPIVVRMENPEPVTVTEVPTEPWAGDNVIVGVVTVKVADAVSAGTVPTSLPDRTTMYVPAATDGTVNVHVKVPVAVVVWEVQVCPLGAAPLNVMVPIVVRMENPEPVTVTEVPTEPWVTDKTIVGVVTANVAEALFALASVAVTVLAPAVEEGTTKVAEKVPAADVVTVAGTVATVAPLNFIVMVEEEAKLAPVTVTVTPTGPWMGVNVIVGVVTVKVAEAMSRGTLPTSFPETVTV